MSLPAALHELPVDLLPPGLVGAGGNGESVAEVLFEQRRSENLDFCRTMTAVYALHRVMYADDEAEYLAQPPGFGDAIAARRRLAAAEIALGAQVSTLLRLGPRASLHAVEAAVGFVERLPLVFGLIGSNVISPKAGEVALTRSRVLDGAQARQFDALLHERLTGGDYDVMSIPALREAADLLVLGIDPDAAEKRRKAAERDRTVTFRPEEDGMAAAFALLPAHDMRELAARIDYIAGTVCEADPRTMPQKRADGLMQLTRGLGTLGCQCDAAQCRYREARVNGEPDADGVVARFVTLITVVVNERDVAGRRVAGQDSAEAPVRVSDVSDVVEPRADSGAGSDVGTDLGAHEATGVDAADDSLGGSTASGFGYLAGHGPITGQHARDLAARADAKIRPFGKPILDEQIHDALNRDVANPDEAVGDEQRLDQLSGRELSPEEPTAGTVDFARAWADIVFHFESCPGDHGDGGEETDFGGPDGGPPALPPPPSPPDGDGVIGADGGGVGRRPEPGLGRVDPARPDVRAAGPLVQAQGSAGYRPSADLRRYLALVYPRCVFPYCTRPASRAQIDHSREFDHRSPESGGRTTAQGLQPLCVPHHQLKTGGSWIDARLADGRILWIAPDLRRYIVDPSGTVLRLFPDLARVRWSVPAGGPSSPDSVSDGARGTQGPPPPGGRTRLQREHARRERLRRFHIEEVQADEARKNMPRSRFEELVEVALGAPAPPPPDNEPPPF